MKEFVISKDIYKGIFPFIPDKDIKNKEKSKSELLKEIEFMNVEIYDK